MIRTIEAIIDEHETALLSEAALGRDWNRPEEEAAWNHLMRDEANHGDCQQT